MILEFERADRMRDALDRIRLAVREIIGRVNAPVSAGARVRGVQNAVENRIAQVDIPRAHIDFRAQHAGAVRKFSPSHATEEVKVFAGEAVAVWAVAAGLGQCAARGSDLLRALIVDISKAALDQVFGPFIELIEVIRGMIQVRPPIKAEPAHVALDRVDIGLLLLDRIGVVKTQMAAAAEFLGDPEIEADRLGVTDMQIPVRLRRKPSHDLRMPPGREIRGDDVANKIPSAVALPSCLDRAHFSVRPVWLRPMWPIAAAAPSPAASASPSVG